MVAPVVVTKVTKVKNLHRMYDRVFRPDLSKYSGKIERYTGGVKITNILKKILKNEAL